VQQEQRDHQSKHPRLPRHLLRIGSILIAAVIAVGTVVLFLTQGPGIAIGTLFAVVIIGIGISSLLGIGPRSAELWTVPLRSDEHRTKAFPRAAQFVRLEQEEKESGGHPSTDGRGVS
jgi:hypothetical protein